MITSGLLEDDDALCLLQLGPEYRQIVLKTDLASRNLRRLSSREITKEEADTYRNIVRREQDSYLSAIAKRMEQK